MTGIWRPAPPGDERSLDLLKGQAKVPLPESYLGHLANSNGGEGHLGVDPGWISFWPAQDVIAMNDSYRIAEFLPGFFGFASNGGGELLAFDFRAQEPFPIIAVPFIPMDVREAVQVARSFDDLRRLIGKTCDAA